MDIRVQIQVLKQALQINEKTSLKRVQIDQVMEEDIADVIAAWTGIPMNKISESESKNLLNMEETLHKRLIGQHQAIISVSKAIRRARVGLRNPDRPIASFLFAGPTGVGKTELTKALASYMFGTEDTMVRLDMSEYMEKHTVAKLIGSPPGYVGYSEGGQLTEAVRSKPYTVVLFDEVEKAHPDIFNTLLQVLDEGRLTDSNGRVVDFTNTIIVMTSNIGARKLADFGTGIGFSTSSSMLEEQAKMDSIIKKELKNKFSPEFLNRLDDIVLFDQLASEDVIDIVDIELSKFCERMSRKGYTFKFNKNAREFLAKEGYDQAYGARPIKRAIQRYVEDVVADSILDGLLKEGKSYTISKDGKLDKLKIK